MIFDSGTATQHRRRALVTGGTGFVGSHLVQALLAEHWEVHLLVRQSSCGRSGDVHLHPYQGETSHVLEAMQHSQPDVVFHLASLFLAQHTPEQILPLIQANVLLGTQLLEAMRLTGLRSLINTGTCWQYFERDTYMPVNLYAATKQAFEDILAYYVEATGLRSITLSLFDTYGRGDTRRKLLPVLFDSLQNDTVLEMSPGHQVLDLLHVSDLCAAFLHAAELLRDPQRSPAATYAVSGGQRRSLREIVALLEATASRPLRITWGAKPYRQREVMQPWNGTPLPGWSPRMDLLTGLRDLLEERSLLPSTPSLVFDPATFPVRPRAAPWNA